MSRRQLVFLPGLLCDDALWRQQADALSDIAAPFIADLTRDDAVTTMAQRVLSTAPDRFALVALSMGGYVAWEILRQAPERVLRLALLDTSARADDAARAAQRTATLAAAGAGRFAGVTDRLLPRLIHASRIAGPVGEAVKAMAARVGGEAFARQQRAILGRQDALALLSGISIPTLVGVGDSDVLTPVAESRVIHAGIAGSRLHVFRECGHLPPLESPEETTDVLRAWLIGADA